MCCNRLWNEYVVIMMIVMVPAHAFAVQLLIVIIACEAVQGLHVDKATTHVEPTLTVHV